MGTTHIRLMKDRRREMIPIDKIKVINSRTRDEGQFALNVQSIDAVGQIKDIRVNDKFLAKTGFYELICGEGRLIAQQRLGQTQIRAEIVSCTRKQAYLESLVENLARARPGTMDFARELKSLHDEGWDFERLAKISCRSVEYIRQYIRLVENGEDRLIHGVEQEIIPMSFAVLVAETEDSAVQNCLIDAFDQGIVNSNNYAKARAIITGRADRRHKRKESDGAYTVANLTEDIATATHEKDSFARQAEGKESRLFMLLMGLTTLWEDERFVHLLKAEGLETRPALTGTYSVGSRNGHKEGGPA